MKHTPYTTKTGLQIGCRYQENGVRMPIVGDMVTIQEALLATPAYARSIRMSRLTLKVSVFLTLLAIFAMMTIR
jgi:hypothetical protein